MEKKEFTCKRDDLVIRGHVYIPDGDKEKWPTLIMSHSFGSNESEMMPYAEHMVEKGICCFVYNFCGGSLFPVPEGVVKSDGDFSGMTIESEMADLYAVIQYAKTQSFVDSENIMIVGGSQGGFVSARVAAKYPDEVKKLIMLYPALCIPEDSWAGQMLFFKFDPNNVPDFIETEAMPNLRLNGEYVRQSQKINIVEELKSYPGEVYLAHGREDEVVAFSYAERVANERPETVFFPFMKAKHGFKDEIDTAKRFVEMAILGYTQILNLEVEITDIEKTTPEEGVIDQKLYFNAKCDNKFFKGETKPGYFDRQIWKDGKPVSFCADYILEGTDCDGKECKIHIVNRNDGTGWVPTVDTDSKALDFLNKGDCHTLTDFREKGINIMIYAKK